jgi:diguanylate cyclase (GGDEF)-like protein/PAS domain S-box-containing protein
VSSDDRQPPAGLDDTPGSGDSIRGRPDAGRHPTLAAFAEAERVSDTAHEMASVRGLAETARRDPRAGDRGARRRSGGTPRSPEALDDPPARADGTLAVKASSSRILLPYCLWMASLAAIYLLVPALGILAWAATVLSSTAAFGIGIARNRPRRRWPWIFLGAGLLTFAVGTVFALAVVPPGQFPSQADVVFLGVSLPLFFVGLLSLTRSGAAILDRASMIDAVILTVGAGFLAWTFLINPYLQNPELNTLQKAVSIAYPMADVLVLAILARLGLTATRSWSVTLLIVSGAALLTADVLYGLSRLNGDWALGGPIDLGWLLFYIAGGAAVLHPSMTWLTEPRMLTRTQVALRRGVLTVASLLAPAALLIQALRGPVLDGVLIATVSAVLILLALARMSAVASSLRQTLARERQLRLACEALLVSTDTDQVSDVLRQAVGQMLPPGTAHRVVVNAQDTAALEGRPGRDVAGRPPIDTGADAVAIRYVSALPADVAVQLAEYELALCCRLAIGPQQVGDLFVGADELALIALQDSLPILAGQAATMIDRIALNSEISRRDSQAYFRTLVLNATEVIAIIDDDNRVTYASPAAEPVFGTADLTGDSVLSVIDPSQRDDVRATLDAARAGEESDALDLWLVRRANGEQAYAEVAVRDMRHEPGVKGLVITVRDVTERRRLEQELIDRAYLDPLTGMGNRLQFQDDVTAAAEAATAEKGIAGVMVINIDDFRMVNDTMGHEVGDELLIALARRLSDALAGQGTVARLGADEFGAVIGNAPDAALVEQLAERIVRLANEPFQVGGSVVTTRLRVGVATTADADTAQQLLGQADVALATAKNSNTTRWRRYEESLHAEVLERMQLKADLDPALDDGSFLLHYQPIVDLDSARTMGFEALVRWLHPTRGMVSPATFIPVAEESGLIVQLGGWVLRTAVAAAAGWQRLNPAEPQYVSVNVSVRQFRSPGFVEQVFDELARFDLPVHLLTLEITESLLLGEHEQIQTDIARLRDAGIKVSIDDFGTGYSSLSYLHRIPVDTLKLDKSFVDTISTSSQQADLVRGIIQLADTLALQVVAEGVETSAERALLLDAGCRLGQGYLFARPLSEENALQRVADEARAAHV